MEKGLSQDKRPWGAWWDIYIGEGFRVKRILVKPGHRLSYQRHRFREEHWVFVEGEGVVTLEGEKITVKRGSYLNIPVFSLHRVENTGKTPLVFIEVQIGEILSEEDIERVEDDYGRAGIAGQGKFDTSG